MEDLRNVNSEGYNLGVNKCSSLCTLCKFSLDSIGSARTLRLTCEQDISMKDMDESYTIKDVAPLLRLKREEDKGSMALSFVSSVDNKAREDDSSPDDNRVSSVHTSSQNCLEIRMDDVEGESSKGQLNVAQDYVESNSLDNPSSMVKGNECSNIQDPQIAHNVAAAIYDEDKIARIKWEDRTKLAEENDRTEMDIAVSGNNEFDDAFESQFPKEEELQRIECEALNIKKPGWLESPAVPPDFKTLRGRILKRRELILAMAQELLNLSCHVENIRKTMLQNDINVASAASGPCCSKAATGRKRSGELPFYNSNRQNSGFIAKKIKPDTEEFFKP